MAGSVVDEALCPTFEEELRLLERETGRLLAGVERDFGFPDPPRTAGDDVLVEGLEESYLVSGE